MSHLFKMSTGITEPVVKVVPPVNTRNWEKLLSREDNGYLLVWLVYDGCTNYEGEKILLFNDTTWKQLKRQKDIDPHFSEDTKLRYPVGRFVPTVDGWHMGVNAMGFNPGD